MDPHVIFALVDLVWLLNVLIVATGLGMVIFFHELGHFLVAKWCGVYVERFSIGFGPVLLARKWGETEYALSILPFGGYVKMLGQDDMDPGQMTDEQIADNPRSYTAKTVLQRMAIISAGVIMNVLTAVIFFMIAFSSGIQAIDRGVGFVQVGMPAWRHGLQPGDEITRINGRQVKEFNDISRRTALSRGEISISGVSADGETFAIDIHPEKTGILRKIGVGPAASLMVLDTPLPEQAPLALPGTAAARTEFQPGDVIGSVNGEAVADFHEFSKAMNRYASEPVELAVTRKPEKGKEQGEQAKLTLAPLNFQGFGFRMGMGKITEIQMGSPAADVGFQTQDLISKVSYQRPVEQAAEGESTSEWVTLDVGNDIDPFRLTEFFSAHAGEEVLVTVTREVQGGTPETKELKVVPRDRSPWSEAPVIEGSPLSIPAIGVAYHLVPTVFAVTPDGEAASKGVKTRDTITKMELIRAPGGTTDGIHEDSRVIEIGEENWAFAFWLLQEEARTRIAKLTIKPKESDTLSTVELNPQPIADWYLPTARGIRFMPKQIEIQSESLADAFGMGVHYTLNSIEDIYLTLRGLFTRDISPKGLSGPIGIAKLAYGFASLGLPHFVLFLGLISVNLAVINFLPIPVLDGGHMVFLLWEGITRRRPPEKIVTAATVVGLFFVGLLMLMVIYLDLFVSKI